MLIKLISLALYNSVLNNKINMPNDCLINYYITPCILLPFITVLISIYLVMSRVNYKNIV